MKEIVKAKQAVVEAGHYYKVMGPSALSLMGWNIGKEVASEQNADLALFVDDYHAKQDFLSEGDEFLPPDESTAAIQMLESEADHVFSEADLAKLAPAKIQELVEAGLIKYNQKKGSFWVKNVLVGKVATMGGGSYELADIQPTCVFLDHMLLTEKAKFGGEQTIVLPEIYKREQSQLATVMSKIAIPELVSYNGVFYDGNGATTEEAIYG